MSKQVKIAAGKIHNHALLEAKTYAISHGQSLVEEVAYGRGFKSGFIEGYERAEKDTIERAIEWLKANAENYIGDVTPTYPDAPQKLIIGGMCWEHLKQAIKEE